jgi:hypothetical protein
MSSNWFQSDPNRAPDWNFEPGKLHHLFVGNEGRLFDFRRTPVRIERLAHDNGLATVQILAFEDRGALWDLPYEEVGKYQFKKGSAKASAEALRQIEEAVTRLNREVEIPCDPSRRDQTLEFISQERRRADAWLTDHSQFSRSRSQLPAAC